MKAIINQLAKAQPTIADLAAFAASYRQQHPQGSDLTESNIRQAFDQYKKTSRKFRRNPPPVDK